MAVDTESMAAFAKAHKQLLDGELRAEKETTGVLLQTLSPAALARAGLAICNLVVGSQRTGLGGKLVLELEPDAAVSSGAGLTLDHGIRVGDIVRIASQPRGQERKKEAQELRDQGADAVVVKTNQRAISVAVDRDDDAEPLTGRIWVVKLANEVTYKRMNWVLDRMSTLPSSEQTSLMRICFGEEKPTSHPSNLEAELQSLSFLDETLNDSQREAIRFAILAPEIALIHGPPGTGKTYTLVELIRQLLAHQQRVLVCGPSNIAVDNIVERLAPHKVRMIRLGHPARLLPSVVDHSLDVLTRTSDAAALVQDIRKEMDDKQASIKKTRNGRERKAIYGEIRELRKDYRDRERQAVAQLVRNAQVVLTTLHGAGGAQLRNERFDVVIIDEASQALEASSWIALLAARKVVLAGDHLQLPPTIKSRNDNTTQVKSEKSKGAGTKSDHSTQSKIQKSQSTTAGFRLETTLFDRLLAMYGPSVKRMLTTQYRMHQTIMDFPATELYESRLTAADSVKARLLKDLAYDVADTDDTREPLVFWDTQGGDFAETKDEMDGVASGKGTQNGARTRKDVLLGDSKSNAMEAALVKKHVATLVQAGVRPDDIAVITPYNGQLAIMAPDLKERFPGIELGSVDGFQGREKEAVIVSLVRSNPEHDVGFLSDRRRLNVAMTRPKRHLCVIGDSETIAHGGPFLKRWMAFLEEHADLRYPNASDLQAD